MPVAESLVVDQRVLHLHVVGCLQQRQVVERGACQLLLLGSCLWLQSQEVDPGAIRLQLLLLGQPWLKQVILAGEQKAIR